jgi:hypothetical protein
VLYKHVNNWRRELEVKSDKGKGRSEKREGKSEKGEGKEYQARNIE